VRPHKPDDAGNEDKLDSKVEAMEARFESGIGLPTITEFHSDVSENVTPGPPTDKGIQVEAELGRTGECPSSESIFR
jgi:hypothetical protein